MNLSIYSHDENDPLGTSLPFLVLSCANEGEWINAKKFHKLIREMTGQDFDARRVTVTLTALTASALSTVGKDGLEVSLHYLVGEGSTQGKHYRRTPLGTMAIDYIRFTHAAIKESR